MKVAAISQYNTAVLAESRRSDDITMELIGRFDVYLSGTFPAIPSAEGRRALLGALEPLTLT